jgi:hypothetical protein
MRLRPTAPAWGRTPANSARLMASLALVCALILPASAQPKAKKPDKTEPAAAPAKEDGKAPPKKDGRDGKDGGKAAVKNFDFTDFNLSGKMRTPQLLYFLERANEELERASLEKRSFIPHLVRTVEEEAL